MKKFVLKRIGLNINQQSHTLQLPLLIHPSRKAGVIIINYPGYNGDIDGYNNKYVTLAELLQEKVGTVIRSGNHHHTMQDIDYQESVKDDLKAIIEYAIKFSKDLCNSKDPVIYLMGFSAGASAIAAVAHEYPQIKKILLISPSGDAGVETMKNGLYHYTGEVYILSGENDEVVGPEIAHQVAQMVKSIISVHAVIPDCDHQFRGKVNGMILSKAPLWAFIEDKTFPSPDGGIVLYE